MSGAVDLLGDVGPDADALGTPVAIWTTGVQDGMAPMDPPVVGRVVGFEGMTMHGCHSILLIRTPHGSVMRSGRAYVRTAIPADLARLADLKASAAARGEP